MPDDRQASTSVNIFSCKPISFFSKNQGFIADIKDGVGRGDTLKLAKVFDMSMQQMLGFNNKTDECSNATHQSMQQELKFYKEKAQKLESDKIFLQNIIDKALINKEK